MNWVEVNITVQFHIYPSALGTFFFALRPLTRRFSSHILTACSAPIGKLAGGICKPSYLSWAMCRRFSLCFWCCQSFRRHKGRWK